jgi:hypothetical protein
MHLKLEVAQALRNKINSETGLSSGALSMGRKTKQKQPD